MKYADIHSHDLNAGPDTIINLRLHDELPQQGSFSVGIHPWESDSVGEGDWQWLRQSAQDPRVVAIGEAGLDALRGPDLSQQERVFREQVALSEALGKPLIIHAVRTHQRIIELRKELRPSQKWIIHGFRGKPQLAQALLRAGCDISLGEKYNPETLAVIPAERLHRESDAPRQSHQ